MKESGEASHVYQIDMENLKGNSSEVNIRDPYNPDIHLNKLLMMAPVESEKKINFKDAVQERLGGIKTILDFKATDTKSSGIRNDSLDKNLSIRINEVTDIIGSNLRHFYLFGILVFRFVTNVTI